jgi:hypothetical protein
MGARERRGVHADSPPRVFAVYLSPLVIDVESAQFPALQAMEQVLVYPTTLGHLVPRTAFSKIAISIYLWFDTPQLPTLACTEVPC